MEPWREQVLVITGALNRPADEIASASGSALSVAADEAASAVVARRARDAFDGLGTRVNNAGTGIYGRAGEVSVADMRHASEVNYGGMAFGSHGVARFGRPGALPLDPANGEPPASDRGEGWL